MKVYIVFLLLSLVPTSVFAIAPCGDHEAESRDLNWRRVAKIAVNAKIQNVKALLCAGFQRHSDDFTNVTYRDDVGSVKTFKVKSLLIKKEILLDHTDLKVGIIKKGNIIALKLNKKSTGINFEKYDIDLSFLRNLSKLSSGRDQRVFRINGHLNKTNNQILLSHGVDKTEFNKLEIGINLALKIDKLKLIDFHSERKVIKTISLPKTDEL